MNDDSKTDSPEHANSVTRREFMGRVTALGIGAAGMDLIGAESALSEPGVDREAGAAPALASGSLMLRFDAKRGTLAAIENRLTGEVISVEGDEFEIFSDEFNLTVANCRLDALKQRSSDLVEATYRSGGRTVTAAYRLGAPNHFFEKRLSVRSPTGYRLKTVAVTKLKLSGIPLGYLRYQYQKSAVYFCRSAAGGICVGLELPFDAAYCDEDSALTLAYHPSIKVRANEPFESEAVFGAIYKRSPQDLDYTDLPLSSESDAMVRMTTAVVGPPRHGLVAVAVGWWSEMEKGTYRSEAQVEGDKRSIQFLAECGIDWLGDSHPWGGEIDKINALREGDKYVPGSLVSDVYQYAQEKKVRMTFWPTMNNTDPWGRWSEEKGQPFRLDRQEWLMFPIREPQRLGSTLATGMLVTESVSGNCIANKPFFNWLMRVHMDGMETGYFPAWTMDGDFFGGPGLVMPANCPSDHHAHLPGDSNYACERALTEMVRRVRESYPHTLITMARPAMDLGVWSNRMADAVFTLDEFGVPEALSGLSGQPLNVIMGDKARTWSRVRVHRHFFPHYLDWPLVFAAPESMGGPAWSSEKIDYVMLSAFSCSPRQCYYIPTKSGMPAADKAEIRRWLEWGRENIRYLERRRDLPDWPAAGTVDGSAHIVDDQGLVFLFNPNPRSMAGAFRLDEESIGVRAGTRFEVSQSHPIVGVKKHVELGGDVTWNVPAHSVVVLRVSRAG